MIQSIQYEHIKWRRQQPRIRVTPQKEFIMKLPFHTISSFTYFNSQSKIGNTHYKNTVTATFHTNLLVQNPCGFWRPPENYN